MYSLIEKSKTAVISKRDPLTPMLRELFRFYSEETLSHAEWLENRELVVRGTGRMLQFLGLAEPDKQSDIGWKANSRLFQLTKKAEPPKADPYKLARTEDDAVLVDMLDGIAAGVLFDSDLFTYFDSAKYFDRREIVIDFTSIVLEGLGLMLEDEDDLEKLAKLGRPLAIRVASTKITRAAKPILSMYVKAQF